MTDFGLQLSQRTPGSPHLRNTLSVDGILLTFVVLSLPCLLYGTWTFGVARLGQEASLIPVLWSGLVQVGPRLLLLLGTAYALARVNGLLRQQAIGLGWLPVAWFLVLLLPPDFSLLPAVLALASAMVFGFFVFGGPGMAPFHTTILAMMFLTLAIGDPGLSVGLGESGSTASSWHLAVQGELSAAGNPWVTGLPGALGAASPGLILLSAVLLVALGQGSLRTLTAGIAGLLLGALSFAAIEGSDPLLGSWYGHLLVGNFVFVLVFIAMDPTCQALTRPGRWAAGFGFGFLVAAFRLVDSTHPEGSIPALLLIYLCTPLMDAAVVRFYAWRRNRLEHG